MLMLCFFNIITDNDVDKKIFITALLRFQKKRKGLQIPMIGLYAGTWIQAVRKESNVLG